MKARNLGRLGGQEGFTVVELMAALTVLSVGFFALAASLGISFRQIGLGRQRQTATEIGNARVEHLRNIPYPSVGLSSQPVHHTDPKNPDYFVSGDGTQFDYTGSGDFEDLIVDSGAGQVLHLEDPLTVGESTFEVYQYVTWADQANNVKRLTVAIVFKQPAQPGASKIVRVSSYFTPGTVIVAGAGSSPAPGVTPVPTPPPVVSPGPGCVGDTQAPTGTFEIVSSTGSETGYTASVSSELAMSYTDDCTPIRARFSNDAITYGTETTYDETNPTVAWTLGSGDGTKSVYGRVRDGLGNERSVGPMTIILDTTKPTVAGSLARTLSCSGTTRTVQLAWGTSTDTHFRGYRVYRSINSSAWEVLGTSNVLNFLDTHSKGLDSVRYYVVGYDKAGNESNATNFIALSKNQCS